MRPDRVFRQKQGRQLACTTITTTTTLGLTLLSCCLRTRAAKNAWSCSRQSNDYSSIGEFGRSPSYPIANAFCAKAPPKTLAERHGRGRREPARERWYRHLRLFQLDWVAETVWRVSKEWKRRTRPRQARK
jgi:hypothetical protein